MTDADPRPFVLAKGSPIQRLVPARARLQPTAGVFAALITWGPLLVIVLLANKASGGIALPSFLGDHGVSARFLICVPAFVAAEYVVKFRIEDVVNYLWNTEILPDSERDRFKELFGKLAASQESRVQNIILLILSYVAVALLTRGMVHESAASWSTTGSGGMAGLTLAGWWYSLISLPIWMFLFLWWMVRMATWWRFLSSVSAMDLSLVPSHPDRVGGLGLLQEAQVAFSAIGFGIAAILSANIAFAMKNQGETLVGAAPTIIVFVLIAVVLIIGPLLAFIPRLILAKRRGLVQYGDLADELFRAFDEKWTPLQGKSQRKLLGDPDPSSLADYGYCYEVVTQMRSVPFDRSSLIVTLGTLLVPFAPLLLVKFSMSEILESLLNVLG